MKRVLTAILFLFVFYSNAQVRPLSLNEAIATSLQNNFDIQLSRNDSLLAALDYAYADYALLPRLSANGGYVLNRNNRQEIFENGTKREREGLKTTNITSSLNLNWTLFDGFRMFIARKRLGQLVELGELQVKAQVVNTVSDVMKLYHDLIRQQQQLSAIEEQMQLSEERLKLAQYKFDIGTGAKPDLLQAQIDLNAQRSASLIQQTAINKLKENLNQLLVLPLENDFTLADTTIVFNPSLTLDSIRGSLTETNPELLTARKSVDIAGLTLRERKAERYPVIEFNSAYNFNKTDNNSVVNPSFQALAIKANGFNYGLTASIPIFNGFNNRRLIKAAELNIKYQQLLYDRSLATINTSIANVYRDYDLYKRTLALEEENIKLVRENIFIARERYRLGVSTFIELREAQQSLADAVNRLIQARYNTKIAEIELLRLRGDIVR